MIYRAPSLFKKLRWRLIGAQMLVVFVGVIVLIISSLVLGFGPIEETVQTLLTELHGVRDPEVEQTISVLSATFRQIVWRSLLMAAIAATLAGLVTSVLLIREILRPLNEIARSSKRIAEGHYDERIAMPNTNELATVAQNFNQMAQALAETEQQRIALIGDVAHELRTPLSGIKGYIEGLLDGFFTDDLETLAQIYQETQRLQKLVDDLHELSRTEAGQVLLHPQPFALFTVVQRLLTQIGPLAQAGNLTLSLDPPTESQPTESQPTESQPIIVFADSDRTAQILLNLLSNAIRYTPESGVVTVSIAIENDHAVIKIQDTGIGIPQKEIAKIFERFYRVDHSRSRSSGGSGIGLTIARSLARSMDGELTAHSLGIDMGSTFTLSLPLDRSSYTDH